MNCDIWCIIAFVFISIFISSQIVKSKKKIFSNFIRELDSNQTKIYLNIIQERSNIFTKGLLLGLIISCLIAYYVYNTKKCKIINVFCIFIGITLLTTTIFYMLYPKTKYIIPYLNTSKQRIYWINIYKTFNRYKYISIIIGIILFILFKYEFHNKIII